MYLEKIERWGYCNPQCKDDDDGFLYANMNILTMDECKTLFKYCEDCFINFNDGLELCAGKKHEFPQGTFSFQRFKKRSKKFLSDTKEAKKFGTQLPTQYTYRPRSKVVRISPKTKEKYPYNWYTGGVDSCQGDSGGPLWRNIKVTQTSNHVKFISLYLPSISGEP